MEIGICPDNSFPYKGDCVSAFEIPSFFHHFGLLPSCFGKNDGSYQYPNYPCEVYYTCNNGTAKGAKCPETQLFNALSGTCMGAVC